MNLLPEELRKAEERELKKPVPPAAKAGFSAPSSQFEDRLRQVSTPTQSPWGKLKSWFGTVPPPEAESKPDLSLPPLPPIKRSSGGGPPRISPRSASTSAGSPAVPMPPTPSAKVVAKEAVVPADGKIEAKEPPPIPLGMLLDVNLLPGEARPQAGGERPGIRLAAIAGGALLLVGIAYAVLSSLVVSRQEKLDSLELEMNQFSQQIDASRKSIDAAELGGRKMKNLDMLLAKRPDWLKFFTRIEALTLNSVTYPTMAVTDTGEISLSAEAPNVTDLARQLKVFEEAHDIINEVSIGAISVAESEAAGSQSTRTAFRIQLVPGWLSSNSQPPL